MTRNRFTPGYPQRGSLWRGFSMLEILISILIMVVGLLGFLGLQARAQVAEIEAYQRGQALILMQDMVDRLNTNRKAADCYVAGTLGTGYSGTPVCTATTGTPATRAIADQDLGAWNQLLLGAAETLPGGNKVGAVIGARGCVTKSAAISGATPYRVSVAWQGLVGTVAPTVADAAAICGQNQYGGSGGEPLRREVSATVYLADLN